MDLHSRDLSRNCRDAWGDTTKSNSNSLTEEMTNVRDPCKHRGDSVEKYALASPTLPYQVIYKIDPIFSATTAIFVYDFLRRTYTAEKYTQPQIYTNTHSQFLLPVSQLHNSRGRSCKSVRTTKAEGKREGRRALLRLLELYIWLSAKRDLTGCHWHSSRL